MESELHKLLYGFGLTDEQIVQVVTMVDADRSAAIKMLEEANRGWQTICERLERNIRGRFAAGPACDHIIEKIKSGEY